MLSKSARMLLPLTLLVPFLIIGPTRLSAQSSPAIDRSLIPLETGSLDPLPYRSTTSPVQFTADPQPSTGRASSVTEPTSGSIDSLLSPLAGHAAFAVDVYPDEKMYYIPNTNTPGDWISVGDVAGTAYCAGDFVGNDFGQLYVIDYNLNELHTLDTITGADTIIGACNPVSGQNWSGATGTAGGTLYASSTNDSISYLYTVKFDT